MVNMHNREARLTSIIDKLRADGHRITPQRRAVMEILFDSDDHPCIDTIFARIRKRFPMTSLATVYKTVALLKEMGEVHELGPIHDLNRYDASKPYPHAHLICIKCGRIRDLGLDITEEELIDKITQDTGYDIVWHRHDFFGICPDCQNESDATTEETNND